MSVPVLEINDKFRGEQPVDGVDHDDRFLAIKGAGGDQQEHQVDTGGGRARAIQREIQRQSLLHK